MKRYLLILFLLCNLACFAQRNVYGFHARGAGGREIPMSEYKGKVLLVVNTATQCGFTPQYAALQELYEKYKDQGLVILDFPCNQFGEQAPGSIAQIGEFCTANYNTTFQRFDKVMVNGDHATPLFAFLRKKLPFRGFDLTTPLGQRMDAMFRQTDPDYAKSNDVKWNFTKFLINRKGRPVQRFEPTADMHDVEAAIQRLL